MAPEPIKADPDRLLSWVSSITEVPADQIEQWIVVAVKKDDTFRVGSDLCCSAHAVMVLAATAADLAASVGTTMHHKMN